MEMAFNVIVNVIASQINKIHKQTRSSLKNKICFIVGKRKAWQWQKGRVKNSVCPYQFFSGYGSFKYNGRCLVGGKWHQIYQDSSCRLLQFLWSYYLVWNIFDISKLKTQKYKYLINSINFISFKMHIDYWNQQCRLDLIVQGYITLDVK